MDKQNKWTKNIQTDLALETHELLTEYYETEDLDGVKMKVEKSGDGDIVITSVKIVNKTGEKNMGRPIGNYITIESDSMKTNEVEIHEKISKMFSKKLHEIYSFKKTDNVLVVGLGNWNVTPDALGPKVVSKMFVTRHLKETMPKAIKDCVAVSAISPGVMGITGIETQEIIKGIVDKTNPTLVIAVDALASRKTSRVNSTIQISDTGISPGAGLGNKRTSLDKTTLGVDVIGIGVPTVVDAATLVNDTMDLILKAMLDATDKSKEFYQTLLSLEDDDKYDMIKEILSPYVGNMFVTPKEIDDVVEKISLIIANSLNIALQPDLDFSDINRYIN